MRKKIFGFDKFFEKELTLPDLAKEPKRGDALVRKLRNGEKLPLNAGGSVDIEKMKDPNIDGEWATASQAVSNMTDGEGNFDILKASEYLKNKKKSSTYGIGMVPVFRDEDTGKEYKLTDFKKDAEFGGKGAGVRIREHESIQILFLAKRLHEGKNYPNATVNARTKEYSYPEIAKILESFVGLKDFRFGDIEAKPVNDFVLTEEMLEHYCSDQSWLSTFSNVPNLLATQKDSKGSLILGSNRAYTIFHASYKGSDATPNVIFSKFKQLSKGVKASESLDSKYFSRLPYPAESPRYSAAFDRKSKEEIEFSKYCPADIYIVDTNSIEDLNRGIMACADMFELNTYLNDSFADRQIIPISLKRVGPSPRSATIIINAEEGMKLPTFDVKSFRLSVDAEKGIGSKIMTDSEWINNGEKISRQRNLTLDSPNTGKNSNIDGEIDGVWARHGKVSLVWIKRFIEGSDIYHKISGKTAAPIMEWPQLAKMDVGQLREMLRGIQADIALLRPQIGIDIFYDLKGREIKENAEKKLISKIQSLQIIKALSMIDKNDESKSEVDRIVSNMLLYALSIQNPGFSSPKYVRVI